MCLLSVRLIILVVLLHETTALNAIIQIAYSATQDKNTKKIRFDKEKMKICNIVEISFANAESWHILKVRKPMANG